MIPTRTLVAVSLLAATRLLAQFPTPQISVDPIDPTSTDDVTLFVQQVASCPPPPSVTRTGFAIAVTLQPGLCLSPPAVVTQPIDLEELAAGTYSVVVHSAGLPLQNFSFSVLDANSTVVVTQSVGASAGGTTVNLVVAAAHCLNKPPGSCPPPSITFDGTPATNVVVIDQSHFRATTPPHAPGAVQVTVSDDTFTKSSYAFRYYDPAAPPSDKFFERILIPVIFNGPGAAGSNWVTELSLRNDNDFFVEPWRPISQSPSIEPLTPVRFGSTDEPEGTFLVVPRQAASNLFFHAAVRDTSRSDSDWATETPVVRANDFKMNLELLDIPVDSRFRTMLRIYAATSPLPGYESFVHVIFYLMDDGHDLGGTFPSFANPCSDVLTCAQQPSYTAVADLTSGLPAGRIGIQIQAAVPIWAFATITNNETQHVTVVSPR
ncbi:MAG TPA: IPT/TIG domain-containing protein [Thermoanaerobaculia bacterium]|nr:IPT/TIG domain-containing protein [Thermoanaerobaculia bacterium]